MRTRTFRDWAGPGMALGAILVIVAVGLCLAHAADHGVGDDLCLGLAATTLIPLLALPLAPTGQFRPALASAYPSALPELLAPPPEA